MKRENSYSKPESFGLDKGTYFSISEEGLGDIFEILRSGLYSDTITAPIREYICNAYDACLDAETDPDQIEIGLPSALNRNFTVRDFGEGLSEQEMRQLYPCYGASTKKNDDRPIGGFGIGSKSAFAYASQFSVVSWNKGRKISFLFSLDETGKGKAMKISEEDSSDPSGIKISIPVKDRDISTFLSKTSRFCKHLPFSPKILGNEDYLHAEKDSDPLYEVGKIKAWKETHGKLSVIMGGVLYNVNKELLNDKLQEPFKTLISKHKIQIFADMGEVDPAPSRETLVYNAKTIGFLKQELSVFLVDLVKDLHEQYSWHSCSWQKELFRQEHSFITKHFPSKFDYEEKNTHLGDTSDYDGFDVRLYQLDSYDRETNLRSQRFSKNYSDRQTIIPKKKSAILWNDKGYSRTIGKVRELFSQDYELQQVYLVSPCPYYKGEDEKKATDLKKKLGVETVSFLASETNSYKLPRNVAKASSFMRLTTNVGWRPKISDHWVSVDEVPEEGGVYVERKSFQPIFEGVTYKVTEFIEDVLDNLKNLGLQGRKIYGIKPEEVSSLGPEWVSLESVVKAFKKEKTDFILNNAKESDFKEVALGKFTASHYRSLDKEGVEVFRSCFIPSLREAADKLHYLHFPTDNKEERKEIKEAIRQAVRYGPNLLGRWRGEVERIYKDIEKSTEEFRKKMISEVPVLGMLKRDVLNEWSYMNDREKNVIKDLLR